MLQISIHKQLNTRSHLELKFKKHWICTPNVLHGIPGMVLNHRALLPAPFILNYLNMGCGRYVFCHWCQQYFLSLLRQFLIYTMLSVAAGGGPPNEACIVHHGPYELLIQQNSFPDGETTSPV